MASPHDGRSPRPEPVLITEAEPSQFDQQASRKKRYAITMLIRAASVVLAVSLLHVIPLWADITLAAVGTFLPGFAVVIANDRPPKKKQAVNRYQGRPDHQLESRTHTVIDGGTAA